MVILLLLFLISTVICWIIKSSTFQEYLFYLKANSRKWNIEHCFVCVLGITYYNEKENSTHMILEAIKVAMKIWTRALARVHNRDVASMKHGLSCNMYNSSLTWHHGGRKLFTYVCYICCFCIWIIRTMPPN